MSHEISSSESNPAGGGLTVQTFGIAVGGELAEAVAVVAVQDSVDGGLATDVLNLSAAEIVAGGEDMGVGIAERGHHRLPEVLAHGGIGLFELDFIEEAALEGAVQVLRQVRGGNHDAVQRLHLLQDDVLDGVLHLIYSALCSLLADADDGVGFSSSRARGSGRTAP